MLSDGLYDVPAGKVAMVVTQLEMTAPAPTRDRNLPEGITFRQVEPDLAWYRDVIERVGANWLWYERRAMNDADLAAILNHPEVAVYTLQKEGRDEALLELDFTQEGTCKLAYFGLTQPIIGTGAGRFLMDQAIALAWANPIKRFHLHTCSLDSPQALGFYIRSGFTPYRRQVEIYDDPRLVGHLDATAAPHVPVLR